MLQRSSTAAPSLSALFTRQCFPLYNAFSNFNFTPVLLKEGKIFTCAFCTRSCISASEGFAVRQVCGCCPAKDCNVEDGFLPAITNGMSNVSNTSFSSQHAAFSFSFTERLPWYKQKYPLPGE